MIYSIKFGIAPILIEHSREVYNILDLIGDLGGVLEVFSLIFGLFVAPIAEHSFTMRAMRKLFLAKTKDRGLFRPMKKKTVNKREPT